jgi:PPOX class probable F420-dependent enzyme
VDEPTAHRVLADARVGRLATVTPAGGPHLVPCCFTLAVTTIYSAVDAKPKLTLALRRLENIRANPAASLLVDHYDENWSALWWVRVDGPGRIVEEEDERLHAVHLLATKYPQYRAEPPPGAVIALEIERWTFWAA